jgi:hypothetical protein
METVFGITSSFNSNMTNEEKIAITEKLNFFNLRGTNFDENTHPFFPKELTIEQQKVFENMFEHILQQGKEITAHIINEYDSSNQADIDFVNAIGGIHSLFHTIEMCQA